MALSEILHLPFSAPGPSTIDILRGIIGDLDAGRITLNHALDFVAEVQEHTPDYYDVGVPAESIMQIEALVSAITGTEHNFSEINVTENGVPVGNTADDIENDRIEELRRMELLESENDPNCLIDNPMLSDEAILAFLDPDRVSPNAPEWVIL
jgi:hypothetical protein